MVKSKKAQIHMTETIIVLLIFFIILFIGIFIYYNYTFQDIEQQSKDTKEQQALTQLQILSSMPEFSCTDFSCIDSLKLLAFKQTSENYQNVFSQKTIKIIQVYPEKTNQECTMQNYPDCNTYTIYNNPIKDSQTKKESSIPVSLYFPSTKKYSIAKIMLTQYL